MLCTVGFYALTPTLHFVCIDLWVFLKPTLKVRGSRDGHGRERQLRKIQEVVNFQLEEWTVVKIGSLQCFIEEAAYLT